LLDKQVINVIRDVGFFDDVFAIGLCSKLSKIKNAMTDAEKVQSFRLENHLYKNYHSKIANILNFIMRASFWSIVRYWKI